MAVSDKVLAYVEAVGGEPRFALSDADAVALVRIVGVGAVTQAGDGGRLPLSEVVDAFEPLATGTAPTDVQALVQFATEYQSKAADFWQALSDALILGARIVRKSA